MQMSLRVRLSLLAVATSPFAIANSISAQSAVTPMQSEAAPVAPVTQHPQPDPAASLTTPASSQEPQMGIEADTKRLYQLALELRTEVAKTYRQSLSVAVLKKAEELEKMAKNLKSEMDHEASAKKR